MQSIFFLSYGSAQSVARSCCSHLETMRGFRLKEEEHSDQSKGGEQQAAEIDSVLMRSLLLGKVFFKQLW